MPGVFDSDPAKHQKGGTPRTQGHKGKKKMIRAKTKRYKGDSEMYKGNKEMDKGEKRKG